MCLSKVLLLVLIAVIVNYTESIPVRTKRAFSYIANETACTVDHIVYKDGDPIPTDDPCETCRCRPPGFTCVLRECEVKTGCRAIRRIGECCPLYQCGCEHDGKYYRDGERIPNAESPCYSCYCQGSSITCSLADCKFRFDCEPDYIINECCPRYDHCQPEFDFNFVTVSSTDIPRLTREYFNNQTGSTIAASFSTPQMSSTMAMSGVQPEVTNSILITQTQNTEAMDDISETTVEDNADDKSISTNTFFTSSSTSPKSVEYIPINVTTVAPFNISAKTTIQSIEFVELTEFTTESLARNTFDENASKLEENFVKILEDNQTKSETDNTNYFTTNLPNMEIFSTLQTNSEDDENKIILPIRENSSLVTTEISLIGLENVNQTIMSPSEIMLRSEPDFTATVFLNVTNDPTMVRSAAVTTPSSNIEVFTTEMNKEVDTVTSYKIQETTTENVEIVSIKSDQDVKLNDQLNKTLTVTDSTRENNQSISTHTEVYAEVTTELNDISINTSGEQN